MADSSGNRLTFHKGYRDKKTGKVYNKYHNQREHFSKPKKAENIYWDFQKSLYGNDKFSENEDAFYKDVFKPHLTMQNKKYKKKGNYNRIISMDDYRSKHPPEETLIYIGTQNVNPKNLQAIFEDYREYLSKNCTREDCGIELLNCALHLDETTPHIHFRQVYWCLDSDGNPEISQNKALEGLGYQRPNPAKKSSPNNNAKMTFTAEHRKLLFEIAKQHGVELITEPLPKNEVGLSIDEYCARETARETAREELEVLQNKKEILLQDISDINEFMEFKRKKIEERFEKGKEKIKEDIHKAYENALNEYNSQQENEKQFLWLFQINLKDENQETKKFAKGIRRFSHLAMANALETYKNISEMHENENVVSQPYENEKSLKNDSRHTFDKLKEKRDKSDAENERYGDLIQRTR